MMMTDYVELYTILFNKVTDVILELQQAQQQAEELYMAGGNGIIKLLNPVRDEDEK